MTPQDGLCCANLGERPFPPAQSCECPPPSWANRGKTPGSEHWGSWRPPSARLLPGALTVWLLGAEGSGCALLCLGPGSPHGLGVSVSRPVSRSPCTAPQYFTLLLVIFLLEIIAGALAYVYYQQVRGTDGPWATWTCPGTHGDTHVRDGCAHAGDVHTHGDTHIHRQGAHMHTGPHALQR